MRNLNQIKTSIGNHKERLFQDYPLKSIAIFGSYSRDQQTPDSDLDIMVEFSAPIGVRFIDLADELEGIVGTKVDVVSKNGIKRKYLKSIQK